ncbi:hypothetical protein ABBQ32_002962 [Trebouxia sp. C0010 RCD-2024]
MADSWQRTCKCVDHAKPLARPAVLQQLKPFRRLRSPAATKHQAKQQAVPGHIAVSATASASATETAPVHQCAVADNVLASETFPCGQHNNESLSYLRSLTIRNFALVEEQHVVFRPGLNVITGESGAGKSVLVEAFGQVLGMTARDNCIRQPATSASVEAHFHLLPAQHAVLADLTSAFGMPASVLAHPASRPPDELCLRREFTTVDGSVRSRCYVNGIATSLRVLREIGSSLVDVNGQHAALSIRDSATQLALLDRVAGTSGLLASFAAGVQSLTQMEQQLADIASLGDEEEREELQDMITEVQHSRLQSGEERQLRATLRQLESRRSSVERAGLVHLAVMGEGGIGGVLQGVRALEGHVNAILAQEEAHAGLSAADSEEDEGEDNEAGLGGDADTLESISLIEESLEELAQARSLLKAADNKVGVYARKHRYLQQEHDDAAQRLHVVERLLKQYACTTSTELLTAVAEAEVDLDKWYQMEGQEEELQQQLAAQQQQLREAAAQLSLQRRAAGKKLKTAVESCLAQLAMEGCKFEVSIAWRKNFRASALHMPQELCELAGQDSTSEAAYALGPTGLDQVQFMLGAGPGEPLRPLAEVASGGESARLMLALKAAPAVVTNGDGQRIDNLTAANQAVSPPLMILDELDSGVGSRLGRAIGQLLRRMSRGSTQPAQTSQILCVSHLPQVAAYADSHLCVRKTRDPGGRIRTTIAALDSVNDSAQEIAAMLGLGLTEAWQLLEAAQTDPRGEGL